MKVVRNKTFETNISTLLNEKKVVSHSDMQKIVLSGCYSPCQQGSSGGNKYIVKNM